MSRPLDRGKIRSMDRDMMVRELKDRVAGGRYDVNCDAVAAAFIARQVRCSNPTADCSPWDVESLIPAGPRITRPTGTNGNPDGPQAHNS